MKPGIDGPRPPHDWEERRDRAIRLYRDFARRKEWAGQPLYEGDASAFLAETGNDVVRHLLMARHYAAGRFRAYPPERQQHHHDAFAMLHARQGEVRMSFIRQQARICYKELASRRRDEGWLWCALDDATWMQPWPTPTDRLAFIVGMDPIEARELVRAPVLATVRLLIEAGEHPDPFAPDRDQPWGEAANRIIRRVHLDTCAMLSPRNSATGRTLAGADRAAPARPAPPAGAHPSAG